MSHVDEGTLHAYLDRELASGERERVAAHLAECAACRARLDEERALVARARDLLALAAPAERPAAGLPTRRRARTWDRVRLPLAWAATVTIAFATGRYLQEGRAPGVAVRGTGESAPIAPPISAQPPSAPVRATARAPSRREVARVDQSIPAMTQSAPVPRAAAPVAADVLDAGLAAERLLGQAPAVLPGARIRSVARAESGGIVLAQELESGTVVRLYERPASAAEPSASVNAAARAPERRAPAGVAAPTGMPPAGERLARYVGSLRIEIAGPLPPDSLTKLLDLVR